MGCDIHGSIELHRYDRWREVGQLVWLVGRSYDSFGCLFGVRNSSNFTPLFGDRGFPTERSRTLNERIDEWGGIERVGEVDFHSPSYCTLAEIRDVVWTETADRPDNRISVVDEDGNKKLKGAYIAGVHETLSDGELKRAKSGKRVQLSDTDGEARYAVHKQLTRKEALSGAWEWLLFDYLETLAERVEDATDVRLTVWFDN